MVVMDGRSRYLLAGWAILETMLFGGIINGWASLVFVLKEDGLYSHLCAALPPSSSSAVNSAAGYITTTTTAMLPSTGAAGTTSEFDARPP
ncbi:hypothetical protein ACOMHN_011158 [Nucella lapillus]